MQIKSFLLHIPFVLFSCLSLTAFANCNIQMPVLDQNLPPKEIVQSATDALLADIKKNKATYQNDPECLYTAIDQLLGPTMDFDRFSARVMGKYFKDATKAQHQHFIEVLKKNALKTYANTLIEFEGYSAKVTNEEIANNAKTHKKEAKIDMIIATADGGSYPISYSMTQESNQWIVQNVIINGINLGLTLRNQFSQAMQNNKNDMDKTIENWNADLSDVSSK